VRFAALFAAAVVLGVPGVAAADEYVVNTRDDLAPDQVCDSAPGDCTLREAVDLAGPEDVVRVPAETYVLSRGELVLSGDTIEGAGARETILDGGLKTRVLFVPRLVQAVVSGVTITRGSVAGSSGSSGAGGGIYVEAESTLSLSESAVVGNTAAIGGGIFVAGGLGMTRSTVADNHATGALFAGGGIRVDGLAMIFNSTITGNTASGRSSQGGGIAASGGLATANVTIAGNEAVTGGGVYRADGTDPATNLNNTIVAGNIGSACAGEAALIAAFVGDHDLDDDGSCGFTLAGDKSDVDPLLGPLAENDGSTDTRALLAGSPAIDAGADDTCLDIDQRGTARPAGACDIGAFEYVPPTSSPPPTEQPPPPPPPPPPPANAAQALPPPVVGEQVNVTEPRGTVRIKLPGSSTFVVLDQDKQVPVGTIIDTRNGRVTLVAADGKGGTATADFYGGIFKLGQTKGSNPITTLKLVEKLSCGKRSGKASVARKKKRKRQLWGDGKGRFRTEGDYSSATVRGTKWLTQDSCDSTLTKVVRGSVSVRDFVKRKTVIVRAGKKYVARRRSR
jgi:hypothetical protein